MKCKIIIFYMWDFTDKCGFAHLRHSNCLAWFWICDICIANSYGSCWLYSKTDLGPGYIPKYIKYIICTIMHTLYHFW